MAGYIYHLRPLSNKRFCKIGMTNGRDVENRLKELNSGVYAGFSDWAMVSLALVEDPLEVERSFHKKYSSNKVPMGPEQEVFIVDHEEVEKDFAVYKTVSLEKYLSLSARFNELKELHNKLIEEYSTLRKSIFPSTRFKDFRTTSANLKRDGAMPVPSDLLNTEIEQLKNANTMLAKENNALREGELTRREHRKLVKLLQRYKAKFGELGE